MKKIITTILLIFLYSSGFSQIFNVDTLYKSGPIDKRLNVVILGDGFTKDELPKFSYEAKQFANFFLNYEPYNHYREYFNFFAIPTPSNESGVTNPGTAPDAYPDQPVGVKDTYYGATFGFSIHRLVTISKGFVLFDVLGYNFPAYDLIVVLVNTPFYGGSGGGMAVHTLNISANTIGVHEIGHTLSGLNDEYWPGYGWEGPNMTQTNDSENIRWKNWLNDFNVQIYPHGTEAEAAKWFKPVNGRCLMEYLSEPMCAVCKQATTETILSQVSPLDKIEPDTAGVIKLDSSQVFNLGLLKPQPNSLEVEWRLNGKLLSAKGEELTLSPTEAPDQSILSATVFDSTALSRRDDAKDVRTWNVKWNLVSSASDVFRITSSADSICPGSPVNLSVLGCRGTISWSTGESGNSITINPAVSGQYSAYCAISEKPIDSVSVAVHVFAAPVATASNTGPYFEGSDISLSSSGGTKYQWTGPSNFSTSEQNPVLTNAKVEQAGIYIVNVADDNGCVSQAQTVVKVDPILGIGTEPKEIVTISPNPTRDVIKVETKLSGQSEISIFDSNGRKILSSSFYGKTEIKMNAIAGVYLYRFSNEKGEIAGKVVVQ